MTYTSLDGFAALLGVDRRTVRDQIASGAIPAIRIGRQYRIEVNAALAALEAQAGATQ